MLHVIKQESRLNFIDVNFERLVLECAAKVYLQTLSFIWSSPLSGYNRVLSSSQFGMPVRLPYLIWTQHWQLTELRQIDRDARKTIVESGGLHRLGSTALVYLPRQKGGRGVCLVENEYKLTKIKAVIKLYRNTDPTIQLVRDFEERAVDQGHQSLVKEATKYANEVGISVHLSHPHPTSSNNMAGEVLGQKVKKQLKTAVEDQLRDKIRGKHAPSHTIAGVM